MMSSKLASSVPALLVVWQLYTPASARVNTLIVSIDLTVPLLQTLSAITMLELFSMTSLPLIHTMVGMYTPVASQYTVTLSAMMTSVSCV